MANVPEDKARQETSTELTEQLVSASLDGDHEKMQSLLGQGADANGKVGPGLTALHVATLQGREDIVRCLLDNGADPETPAPASKLVVNWLFGREIAEDGPGAAIAVMHNGAIVYKQGYGLAHLEYDIPIAPSTIFHVASVSKQFTAFAVTMLAEQGKLSLDDAIQKHLPELPDFGVPITIRHLIHHTSGLRDQWQLLAMAGWRLDDVITRDQIMRMVRRQKELNFAPGDENLYCNTGYTLLAETVERVSGQSFREWTQTHIFEPLNMADTHFHDDHQMIVKNRAYSYEPSEDNGFQKSVLSFANVGATSLFTTVEDLMKWLSNFDEASVGGKSVIEQVHQRGVLNNGQELDYAFGLAIGKYRGLTTVGHGGSDAGFRSYLVSFPDEGLAIALLSNLASINTWKLATQVAEVYLSEHMEPTSCPKPKEEVEAPEPASDVPCEDLPSYTGTYFSDELGTAYTLAIEDGKLVAQHQRHNDITLTPSAADRFSGNAWWFGQIHFIRDDSEQVTGFRLTGGRVRNLWFGKHPSE